LFGSKTSFSAPKTSEGNRWTTLEFALLPALRILTTGYSMNAPEINLKSIIVS